MVESSQPELKEAFTAYVKHATDILRRSESSKAGGVSDPVKISYIDPGWRLRSLVDKAEKSVAFSNLASAAERAITAENDANVKPSDSDCSVCLKHFFRRMRFYLRAFSGERLKADSIFDHFWSAIWSRTVKTTKLRLIYGQEYGLTFESQCIDCKIFKIQKFTEDELDTLSHRQINEIFYPNSVLNTKLASQFWFLVEERLNAHSLSIEQSVESDLDAFVKDIYDVGRELPDRALQLLAMHDWTPRVTEEEVGVSDEVVTAFSGFTLPFSIEVTDDVLDSPLPISPMPPLQPSPPGWSTGPDVEAQQDIDLKAIVNKGQKLLKIVDRVKPHWDFITVAMGYLGKAFFTDLNMEHLLWNVAVLDSLLSEKAEVTQTIRRRIGNILGGTEQERKQVRKQFVDLYDFRSDLVHGNNFKKKAQFEHLGKARNFARRVMGWFLDYLLWLDNDLRQRDVGYEHYPRRDELLAVLDFDRGSLDRLNRFIGRLPATFPKF